MIEKSSCISEKLKISIIVPIYNVEKYLPICIESILSQTYNNLEIILVDDGSPDNCPYICKQYADKDNRIRVLHKKNGGLVSARKAGIRVATGDYVLYVDGDDWIDEDYVEKMLMPLTAEKLDMVTTIAVYRNYSDGRQLEQITPMHIGVYKDDNIMQEVCTNYICEDGFYDTYIPTNVYLHLFERAFLLKIQEQVDDDISIGEDMAVIFRSLLEANSVSVINVLGYHYRQSSDSMLHKKGVEHYQHIHTLYNNLKKAVLDAGKEERSASMRKKIARGIFFNLWTGAPDKMLGISNEFLFPFSYVKKGSKVFVYGMGVVGYGMMDAIVKRDSYTLVGCSDQGWKAYADRIKFDNGVECKVYPPEMIIDCDFDYVIIGISRWKIRQQIADYLVCLGIDKEKIALVDQSLLVEENLPF